MKTEETKTKLSGIFKSIADKVKAMLEKEKPQLHNLLLSELKTIYWAERHLIESLEGIADRATTMELKQTILEHLEETRVHAFRLEEAFAELKEEPATRTCDAIVGLLTEANKGIAETADGSLLRDVAIIATCQKIEHYEIATYGTLKTLAETLEYYTVSGKLAANLQDEKNADVRLTHLAEGFVNKQAIKE